MLQYCFCFMLCCLGCKACGMTGDWALAPALEGEVLTTRPLGKSLKSFLSAAPTKSIFFEGGGVHCCLVGQSCLTLCDTRLLCPSPSPRVCSDGRLQITEHWLMVLKTNRDVSSHIYRVSGDRSSLVFGWVAQLYQGSGSVTLWSSSPFSHSLKLQVPYCHSKSDEGLGNGDGVWGDRVSAALFVREESFVFPASSGSYGAPQFEMSPLLAPSSSCLHPSRLFYEAPNTNTPHRVTTYPSQSEPAFQKSPLIDKPLGMCRVSQGNRKVFLNYCLFLIEG